MYDDPTNREFLMSVMSGRIPKELITEARGGEVNVNMEDHKEEEFKKPKVQNFFFPFDNIFVLITLFIVKQIDLVG